jgi:serine O-acetyltransferase
MGVVIGETSVIGDDCMLYQGVTLGGTGRERGKRHPTLGNGVVVGVGAKILGAITLGDNVLVGASSVVLKDVPPNSTVVGVPGRVVAYREPTGGSVHRLPDPVAEMMSSMQGKILEMEDRIRKLEGREPSTEIHESAPGQPESGTEG